MLIIEILCLFCKRKNILEETYYTTLPFLNFSLQLQLHLLIPFLAKNLKLGVDLLGGSGQDVLGVLGDLGEEVLAGGDVVDETDDLAGGPDLLKERSKGARLKERWEEGKGREGKGRREVSE